MTQDERWLQQWQTVIDFMEANKRRPSIIVAEERGMRNWWKNQQKLLNARELNSDRIDKFNELLRLGEKFKHKKPISIKQVKISSFPDSADKKSYLCIILGAIRSKYKMLTV